jgi:1,4-dihydroxy-2-naphthoate octaprenyltransferase
MQLAWMLFCITVQIGTNLHNDYSDFIQGADTDKRVGHARATAKGWLTPTQTCSAAVTSLSATFLCGLYLAATTAQLQNPLLWFFILSSIFNAFAYTAGPFPLGYFGLETWSIAYSGLGEVFVFLYFGLLATLMLPYLLHSQGMLIFWGECFLYATAVGLLATNIIIVNNLRDRHTDVLASKRTTAVRLGRHFALTEYALCLVVSFSIPPLVVFLYDASVWRLLPVVMMPLASKEVSCMRLKDGDRLNAHVGGAAKIQLLACCTIAISILLSPAHTLQ